VYRKVRQQARETQGAAGERYSVSLVSLCELLSHFRVLSDWRDDRQRVLQIGN
jgi:hypothetical protein